MGEGSGWRSATLLHAASPGMGTPGRNRLCPRACLLPSLGVIVIKERRHEEERVSGVWGDVNKVMDLETFQWRCWESCGQESGWEEI